MHALNCETVQLYNVSPFHVHTHHHHVTITTGRFSENWTSDKRVQWEMHLLILITTEEIKWFILTVT